MALEEVDLTELPAAPDDLTAALEGLEDLETEDLVDEEAPTLDLLAEVDLDPDEKLVEPRPPLPPGPVVDNLGA